MLAAGFPTALRLARPARWFGEGGMGAVYRATDTKAFPGPGAKWVVSADGGANPRWSRNDKELFFNSGKSLMIAAVHTRSAFATPKPQVLFDRVFANYLVLPDGRFVMFSTPPMTGVAELEVVENWWEPNRLVR